MGRKIALVILVGLLMYGMWVWVVTDERYASRKEAEHLSAQSFDSLPPGTVSDLDADMQCCSNEQLRRMAITEARSVMKKMYIRQMQCRDDGYGFVFDVAEMRDLLPENPLNTYSIERTTSIVGSINGFEIVATSPHGTFQMNAYGEFGERGWRNPFSAAW